MRTMIHQFPTYCPSPPYPPPREVVSFSRKLLFSSPQRIGSGMKWTTLEYVIAAWKAFLVLLKATSKGVGMKANTFWECVGKAWDELVRQRKAGYGWSPSQLGTGYSIVMQYEVSSMRMFFELPYQKVLRKRLLEDPLNQTYYQSQMPFTTTKPICRHTTFFQ